MTLADAGRRLPPKLAALSREMAWHFWPALGPADSLLAPAAPPETYLDYLETLGLVPPAFSAGPDPERQFTPFGWNRDAVKRNAAYVRPASHPDPAVAAKVNGREFGRALEAELFPEAGDPSRRWFCRDQEELARWVAERHPGRWVAKGNHGQGGIGQFRFRVPGADVAEILGRILRDHAGLALEPEHDLAIEFGVLFRLFGDGSRSEIRCHRLLSRSGGGYIGALKLPSDPELSPWLPSIEKSAQAVAARLHAEGYFGPVGLDMYVHHCEGDLRFRSLVDLNARCSMAYPVHGLARRFPDRAVQMLQFPAKSLLIPRDYEELRKRLGDLHFHPETGRGALWISPLLPGMIRHSLAVADRDEESLQATRRRTMQILSRE